MTLAGTELIPRLTQYVFFFWAIGQDKNPALQQAYSLLRNVAESKPAVDTPESFSPDLYVLCAEIAFQVPYN